MWVQQRPKVFPFARTAVDALRRAGYRCVLLFAFEPDSVLRDTATSRGWPVVDRTTVLPALASVFGDDILP